MTSGKTKIDEAVAEARMDRTPIRGTAKPAITDPRTAAKHAILALLQTNRINSAGRSASDPENRLTNPLNKLGAPCRCIISLTLYDARHSERGSKLESYYSMDFCILFYETLNGHRQRIERWITMPYLMTNAITRRVLTALLFIAITDVSAEGLSKLSLSVGLGPGFGLSRTQILDDRFKLSALRYHALLGADVSASYDLTDKFSLGIRNATNWYRPGSTSMINDYLLCEALFRLDGIFPGLFAGAGGGLGVITYPFDSYWRKHYSATGIGASVVCGYWIGKKIKIVLDNSFCVPKRKDKVLKMVSSGYDYSVSTVTYMYMLYDIHISVCYSIF